MLTEVDSAEIIAYLTKRSKKRKVIIRISLIRELGHKLEKASASIVFDGDKYTFESFRCLSPDNIQVTPTEIVINRKNKYIKQIIERYQPSPRIKLLLDDLMSKC